MKKVIKYCFCALLLLIVNPAQSQVGGAVTAPILEFLTEAQTAELIAGFAEQLAQIGEVITKIQAQIDKVTEVRDKLQKTYDFAEKNYNKLKKVANGIQDFNLEGFIYFSERVINRSLNPADYMLRIDNDKYNAFKKAISYDPGSNISSRAKYSIDYFSSLHPQEALTDLLSWINAQRMNKVKNELASMESTRILDSAALVSIDRLLHDTTLVMTDGERLNLLLQAQQILADNDIKRTTELESIEDELNKKIIEAEVIRRNHNTANSIYAYYNVITMRWNANKGFSLAKHAKKRTKKAKPVIIDTGVQFNR